MLFQHNVESVIWHRHADTIERTFPPRTSGSSTAACSSSKQRQCRSLGPRRRGVRRGRGQPCAEATGSNHVQPVPTGVDTDFFQPRPGATPEPGHAGVHSAPWTGCPTRTAWPSSWTRSCRICAETPGRDVLDRRAESLGQAARARQSGSRMLRSRVRCPTCARPRARQCLRRSAPHRRRHPAQDLRGDGHGRLPSSPPRSAPRASPSAMASIS